MSAEPVPITRGATYMAYYSAPNGHYAADPEYFTRRNPVVSVPLSTYTGPTAVGVYGPGGLTPTRSQPGNDYRVDVVFTTARTRRTAAHPTAPGG